jgi:two-component system response regulator PhcR
MDGEGPVNPGLGIDAPAVLYVDDEPQSLKYFLRAYGGEFRVLTASSAAQADQVLASQVGAIGVLVTDQRMPGESGTQLLARVKERYPLVIRILTTAYADLSDAVSAVNRGEIHRYVLKPWDMDALRADLRGAFDLHRQRRAELDLLAARREAMVALASHLAHEIATPIATIAGAAAGLERYLPTLVEHYRRTRPVTGEDTLIPAAALDALAEAPGLTRASAERVSLLVRLLLVNAGSGVGSTDQWEVMRASALLNETIDSYPFRGGERALVSVEGGDFDLRGPPTLMIHVIYNLLKNALDALSAAGKGAISFALEPGTEWNRLVVTDTGSGIPAAVLPLVFDEFFSLKQAGQGAGMGLPFCRRVLTDLGGEIACESIEGDYTRMELRFPAWREDQP